MVTLVNDLESAIKPRRGNLQKRTSTRMSRIRVSAGMKQQAWIFQQAAQRPARATVKLEELFSELDKGIENLNAAREQLRAYRQAILKEAFEGRLISSPQAMTPEKTSPRTARKLTDIGRCPSRRISSPK
jgi:hypothetical protein